MNTYSARHGLRHSIVEVLESIEGTEDLDRKLRGMLGVRVTLVDLVQDLDIDIGELIALIEINRQQGN